MQAVVLSVGDELVLGQVTDTNAAWLSARLLAHGVFTLYHQTVPDDRSAIVRALRAAAEAADIVVVTGGLGPTADDLCREALAEALGVGLVVHAASLEKLRAFFTRLGRPMPEANRVQALCPQGAEMLENDIGTAPGVRAKLQNAQVFLLPGVPREMERMAEHHLFPALPRPDETAVRTEVLHTFGAGESVVAERLGELMDRRRNPLVGTTASGGVVSVHVRSAGAEPAEAARLLTATVREIENRLGTLVFGHGAETLEGTVGRLLQQSRAKLVTVESCTGGLLAELITAVPGASEYFVGGWVAYANAFKGQELAVPADVLAAHGAVSEPVARLLAEHALHKAGADYALALTGIAGPAGGTADKPVGTVWIALARRSGAGGATVAERFLFPGDRAMIRTRAARSALNMLRLALRTNGSPIGP